MKTFKQVFIKSEADLPEDGFYYAYLKSSNMICLMKMSEGYKPFWIENVDWYLIEVPDNRDAIIEKQKELIEKIKFSRLGWRSSTSDNQEQIISNIIFTINKVIDRIHESELSVFETPPEDK